MLLERAAGEISAFQELAKKMNQWAIVCPVVWTS
jgi:hypothetical protein